MTPQMFSMQRIWGGREGHWRSARGTGDGRGPAGSPAPPSETHPAEVGGGMVQSTDACEKYVYIGKKVTMRGKHTVPLLGGAGGGSPRDVTLTITPFTHPKRTGSGAGALPGSAATSSGSASGRPLLRCGSDTGTWSPAGLGCGDEGKAGEGGRAGGSQPSPRGERAAGLSLWLLPGVTLGMRASARRRGVGNAALRTHCGGRQHSQGMPEPPAARPDPTLP